MLKIDIDEPKTCRECPCSCSVPQVTTSSDWDGNFYKILCRIDYKEHKPFDDTCKLHHEEEVKNCFPAIEGAPIEMYVDGEWVKGKVVKGYRFNDGIVTMETKGGKRYWCGQDRTDQYRPLGEKDE